VTRVNSDGARTLDLLVLWRGSPGWLAKGPERSTGGGSANVYRETTEYGDVRVDLELTHEPRKVTIQDKPVPVSNENVILVDNVDKPRGSTVVRMLRVDPAMPPDNGFPDIWEVIRRSPEMVDFVRCDVRMPDALTQKMADTFCARLAAK
jgi:hypothetical protein